VVLYAATSTAVIGIGFAAQNFGLRQTGIATAVIVAALAAGCFGSLVALRNSHPVPAAKFSPATSSSSSRTGRESPEQSRLNRSRRSESI